MSVLKSKRGESAMQFIETARELEVYTFDKVFTFDNKRRRSSNFPARKGITKMRHKLRTFKRWLDEGKMTIEDIRTSYISWKGHIKHCNAYRTTVNMDALHDKLFLEDGTQ